MPEEARTHDYIRHTFPPIYTPDYMRAAVIVMIQTLEVRTDLAPHFQNQYEFMRNWFNLKLRMENFMSQAKEEKEMNLNEPLFEVLKAARDHLDYCGYGDKWEREVAIAANLPQRIEEAIKRAEKEMTNGKRGERVQGEPDGTPEGPAINRDLDCEADASV